MTAPRDYKSAVLATLTLAVFAAAVIVLHHALARLSLERVLDSLAAVPLHRELLSLLFAAGSYGTLTLYDYLALHGVRRPRPWHKVAPVSFIAFAIGHSVGLSSISGGSVRLRGYSRLGLGTLEIAGVMALVAGTFALGVGTLLAASLLFGAHDAARVLPLAVWQARALGAGLAALIAGYTLLTALKREPFCLLKRRIHLPPVRITLGQIAVGCVDLCFAAASLYILLPDGVRLSYVGFVGLYVLAIQAGVISNVPGGLGVFESVLILLLPGAPSDALLGAVLLYRIVYYLIPLVLGIGWLFGHEALERRRHVARFGSALRLWVENVAPQALAGAVFLAGAVLLISGATPEIDSRMEWLRGLVPLPVLELSHLSGSAIGVGLLILARGLLQRLDGAWWTTLLLLAGGILASLLKGLDYEEALLLAGVMGLLWLARERFYRRASLLDLRSSRAWVLGVVLVVGLAIFVAAVSYRDVQYANELWWQFAFDDDAPRAMRAGLLSVLLAAGYVLWQLFSPARQEPATPDAEALERAHAIAARNPDTLAYLALLGDKQLLFADAGDAFIMYQRSGRSIVALGDPAGNPARFEELVWRYRELCDRASGWPVFYQVSAERIPLYLDLGLSLAKLGEEARVYLPDFSLDGPQRAALRHDYRRCLREGVSFAVLTPGEVTGQMTRLKEISDQWLMRRAGAEKGFSVGRFAPDYLRRFSCACVLRQERIVAFANLWLTRSREEFSVDLMRYGDDAPKGVMDYLFVKLMLWGKEEGYRWFNLGMAPLAGLEQHPLAPFWHKLGRLVHRYGEPFYNFEGLRRYKEKFHPQWRPRFLASPGGMVLPRVLLDTAALIAGGIKETAWK
ncbi:MAG: bifunctional lysylphosphatidylglycerol flippase/synthetase MprF [Sinobacteraceae bacterium]|nr:bifunctional lysylphosphatidylglycerol flippase/synthetase MprF [Nevskiaceae bacterium]